MIEVADLATKSTASCSDWSMGAGIYLNVI